MWHARQANDLEDKSMIMYIVFSRHFFRNLFLLLCMFFFASFASGKKKYYYLLYLLIFVVVHILLGHQCAMSIFNSKQTKTTTTTRFTKLSSSCFPNPGNWLRLPNEKYLSVRLFSSPFVFFFNFHFSTTF